jgi:signal transduction histidine kinase
MLMVVNPGVQAYVLDADGRVAAYIGEPGMVRQEQVALEPIRRFLAGAQLPLRGTDPMGTGIERIFSAAMFPSRPDDRRPPGYLYVVLDGRAQEQVAAETGLRRLWQGALITAGSGLAITLIVGVFVFRRITRPLNELAARMHAHRPRASSAEDEIVGSGDAGGDEVKALDVAFADMTRRIAEQAEHERRQAVAYREMIAGFAHDLRTPLTALHGQLEALADDGVARSVPREQLLAAALKQSSRVRRLSQQLFELAALQAADQVVHRERFRLDELVTDAVRKFDLRGQPPPVMLDGPSPGRIEVEGDLQLIERALDNLIDNALRHAAQGGPVRVSLTCTAGQAQVVVADAGPGLPADLRLRLESGRPLREPALRSGTGGIGGIGLAIAQRIAALHGGRLVPLTAAGGGTRLCLALPID